MESFQTIPNSADLEASAPNQQTCTVSLREAMRSLGYVAVVAWLVLTAECATAVPFTPPAPRMALEAAGPCRIRVGDQLDVRFYQTPELNVEGVPVRRDGRIVYVPKSRIANFDLFIQQCFRDAMPVVPAFPVF